MEYFQDKVAVITGAASGIGQALAERCLQEGMKVMLADVEADALTTTAATFRARYNNPIETQVVDVSVLEALTAPCAMRPLRPMAQCTYCSTTLGLVVRVVPGRALSKTGRG